jgi:hypothetical protein
MVSGYWPYFSVAATIASYIFKWGVAGGFQPTAG